MNNVQSGADLGQVFGFTQDMVDANRRGELTDVQRTKLGNNTRLQSGCLIGYIIAVLIMFAGIAAFYIVVPAGQETIKAQLKGIQEDPVVLPIIVVCLGLVVVAIGGYVLRTYNQINTMKNGTISSVDGAISTSVYSSRYGTASYLRIGGGLFGIGATRFLIQDPATMQFIGAHKGDHYRVYYIKTPRPLQLLSLELI